MDQTTTYDDADVEQQVAPHEASNDVSDSQDILQPDSQDISQPKDLALPVLKENEVYMICMFRRIYLCMLLKM
jgi:hypothetical protein